MWMICEENKTLWLHQIRDEKDSACDSNRNKNTEEEKEKSREEKRKKLMVIHDGQLHFSFRCSAIFTGKKLKLKSSECGAVWRQQAAEGD